MNFPDPPSVSCARLVPKLYRGRPLLFESELAHAIGISSDQLRQVKKQYAECFPASCAFSLSHWEVQQSWPEVADDGSAPGEATAVYTETGAAMAAVLLRAQTSPERIATLLRAFQLARTKSLR